MLSTRSQIFVIWKYFSKNWQPSQNVNNFLLISATLSNICDKTYEKTYRFFYINSNFHYIFTCWQIFTIRKFKKTKCHLFQYVNKILFIPATLNNIFEKNYEKPYKFCNIFLKYASIITVTSSFIIITFLQQKWRPFQKCIFFIFVVLFFFDFGQL